MSGFASKLKEKCKNLILPALFVIGAIIYVSLIFNDNLWMDEAFSAVLVRGVSFEDMLEASANDTLPPLYNVINWCLVNTLGFSSWVLKLSSVVPMILTMMLGLTTIKKRFGCITAAVYIVSMWGAPQLLYYGVEIRMYALGLFFVTATGVICLDIATGIEASDVSRRWLAYKYILLVLTTLGAGYTHHFALVAVGFVHFEFALLLLIKRSKALFGYMCALIASVVFYFPCLLITLKQMKKVSGYFTMPDISVDFIWQCMKLPFTTQITVVSIIWMLIFFGIVICELVMVIRELASGMLSNTGVKCIFSISMMLIIVFVTAFGCFATKILNTNIFSQRYMVPSLGLFWLGFAIFVGEVIRDKRILAIVFGLMFITVARLYISQFNEEYSPGVESMKCYFQDNVKNGDGYLIVEDNYQIEICFRYYFPSFKKYNWENVDECDGTIWYIEVPGYEKEMNKIESNGYKATEAGKFGFDRYRFILWRLNK